MADPKIQLLVQLLHQIKARTPPDDDSTQVTVAGPTSDPSAVTVVNAEQVPSTVTPTNVFRHPDAHPLTLDLLLLEKYGSDWLGWEVETLEVRVPEDFGVDRISELNLSKIQSMKTLHLVDSFWERWEVFCWCTVPMNGIFPDFKIMQVPTVLQCAIAVDVAGKVRSDIAWSDEIKLYLSMVHKHDGILVPQSPLDFVEVDTAGLPVDISTVIERWPSVRASKVPPRGDTVEDEQLRRMLLIYTGLETQRGNLRQQLEVLIHG